MADLYSPAVSRDAPNGWIQFLNGLGSDVQGGGTVSFVNGAVASSPGLVSGGTSQAAVLDGVNDYVTVAADADWENIYNCTVTLLCNPDVITGTRTLLHREGDYTIKLVNGIPQVIIVTNAGPQTLNATSPIPAGQTAHIAFIYRYSTFWGTSNYLFVNGVQVAELALGTSNTHERTVDASPLFLGSLNGTSEFFDGKIAEVVYYQAHLGRKRIAEHASKALGTFTVPVRPYDATFNDIVDAPVGPEWVSQTTGPVDVPYTSWDLRGLLRVVPSAAARSAVMVLKGHVAPKTDWDVIAELTPPNVASKDLRLNLVVNHDGTFNTTAPQTPMNGYCLAWTLNAANTSTLSLIKCVNGVETVMGTTVVGPAWDVLNTKLRLRRTGNVLKFKAWKSSIAEPPTWSGTRTDTGTVLGAGYVAVSFTNAPDNTLRDAWCNFLTVRNRVHERFIVDGGVEKPLLDYVLVNDVELPLVVTDSADL